MAGGKAAAEAGAVTATPVRCSAWLGDGLCLASDSCSVVVHNPETLCNGFRLEQREDTRNDGEHRVAILKRQPQDNDSGVISRRLVLDLREVQIERDEDALLVLTDLGDGRVGRAA